MSFPVGLALALVQVRDVGIYEFYSGRRACKICILFHSPPIVVCLCISSLCPLKQVSSFLIFLFFQ